MDKCFNDLNERKGTTLSNYYVNNHIHTTYSFSPYTPRQAAQQAAKAGLATAGIMDHDSIGGAREFTDECIKLGIAPTIGMECRVRTDGTPLFGRRINNPDQISVAYVAMHGIPESQIEHVEAFIAPYRACRNVRNRDMLAKISDLTGFSLDFDRDIPPISMYGSGGTVTERHLLYLLVGCILKKYAKGAEVIAYLNDKLDITVSGKLLEYLSDAENPYYDYDLLGVLKSSLVPKIYIPADRECPHITEFLAFTKSIGAISAYAYLGDVVGSVTGDKKAQKFEDDYLDILFDSLTELGFDAVTYMPSRNTMTQLALIGEKCRDMNLFQISGEDINTPRQSFVCEAMADPAFAGLIESTWALIGHQKATKKDIQRGLFGEKSIAEHPDLNDRIAYFAGIGRK